jgi:S-adenosylmethionine:tRNA ribosyltransferase-isomerase
MSTNVLDYDFDLPEELIAQSPLLDRSSSKLLVLNDDKSIEHRKFSNIVDYLTDKDVLVLNDTRVIPARLIGSKVNTGAKIEILLLNEVGDNSWKCLIKPAKRIKLEDSITFGDDLLIGTCVGIEEDGIRIINFSYEGIFLEVLDQLGSMPLPPYITEKLSDNERYQTVYSKDPGSVAAPTAGLHFTEDLLSSLKERGVTICYVTLHVGLGTFRPVSVDNVLDHKMHEESYILDEENAKLLRDAKLQSKRIIAVGTTTTRTLETIYRDHNDFISCSGSTDIFIYPGFEFKAIDALITNFHLPKSTLMMLISGLVDRETIINTYLEAIEHEYRFFSFGDSMFINLKKED